MSNNAITASALLASLPVVLQNNESMMALASSIASVLSSRVAEIDSCAIYASIDSLPEELIDILAKDFKVDWMDANYTLEEKRNTLKDSWRVHRLLGTPSAVKTAISAIYEDTEIEEWWEYSGQPYHFRIMISIPEQSIDPIKHSRVLALVNYYKNLRSVLDGVEYHGDEVTAGSYASVAFAGVAIVDSAYAQAY